MCPVTVPEPHLGYKISSRALFAPFVYVYNLHITNIPPPPALCVLSHPQVKAARHNCAAWVLRIFALELLEVTPAYSPEEIGDLLDWLFVSGAVQRAVADGSAVDTSGGVPMMAVLATALDLPAVDLPPGLSPLIQRCLNASTVPYTVSAAPSAPAAPASGYTTVDLSLGARLVQAEVAALAAGARDAAGGGQADFEDGVRAAVCMNVYNKRAAAATHLCQAWGQVRVWGRCPAAWISRRAHIQVHQLLLPRAQILDVAVLGCGGALVGGHSGGGGGGSGTAAVRRLVVTVALPTLRALTTSPAVPHQAGYSPYHTTSQGQVRVGPSATDTAPRSVLLW